LLFEPVDSTDRTPLSPSRPTGRIAARLVAMSDELAEARAELEKEFNEVMESLGDVHVAYQAVNSAAPDDNLHDLLKVLEKAAKEARDGGVIGSGANDHRRALRNYQDLLNPEAG